MDMRIAGVLIVLMSTCVAQCDDEAFVQSAYAQVLDVYSQGARAPYDKFTSVSCGHGISAELDRGIAMTNFLRYCSTVSNNFDRITTNWSAFETNEMVRYTTISAVGYCGADLYTNFCNRVLDSRMEANDDQMETAVTLLYPEGTPMYNYLMMNYNLPGISNIVHRIREIAIQNNKTNTAERCADILSGAEKIYYIEMRDAGAL